mgnify:CR=1 FL=1
MSFFSTSISTGVDSSSSLSSILVMSLSIDLVGTTDGAGPDEEEDEEACGCEGDAIEGVDVVETAPFLEKEDLLVDIW